MRACSAAFQNEVSEFDDQADQVTLKKNTLFEISTVNVSSNALSLAKSKDIDTSPLEKHLSQKEGRVLSAKTKGIIVKSRDALNELLIEDEGKQLSNDTAVSPPKVVT